MENEEIGKDEYIKTRDGYINKVKIIVCKGYPIKELEDSIICDDEVGTIIKPDEIVKHSKDLIDLAELEDILKIKEGNETFYIGFTNDFAEEYADCIQKIKSGELELLRILTKEKFNQESYKVGE